MHIYRTLNAEFKHWPAFTQLCSLFIPCLLDKESGERLSRMVEDACMLLADYSGRLAAEVDDRRQLTRTLSVFLQSQKDGLVQNEQKLEVRKSLFYFDLFIMIVSPQHHCHLVFSDHFILIIFNTF